MEQLLLQLQIQVLLLRVQQLQAQLKSQISVEAQAPREVVSQVKTLNAFPLSSSSVEIDGFVNHFPATVVFEIGKDNRGQFTYSKTIQAVGNDVSSTISGLFPGNKYIYRVSAFSEGGSQTVYGLTKTVFIPCTEEQKLSGIFDCHEK